jgi:hypothetical protein
MSKKSDPDRAYWLTANLAALASGLAAKVGHRPFPDETAQRTEVALWIGDLAEKVSAAIDGRRTPIHQDASDA